MSCTKGMMHEAALVLNVFRAGGDDPTAGVGLLQALGQQHPVRVRRVRWGDKSAQTRHAGSGNKENARRDSAGQLPCPRQSKISSTSTLDLLLFNEAETCQCSRTWLFMAAVRGIGHGTPGQG